MQETLPSVKLVVRASSGIDETRSSSHILDSSPNCFAGLSDFNDQFRALLPPSRVALCSAVDSYSDEIGNRATSPTPPLYSVTLSPLDCRCFEIHVGKCFRPRVGTLPPSPAAHLCLIFVTKQTMICCSEGNTRAWVYASKMSLRLNQNALCEMLLDLCFFSTSIEAVPSTTLCVVLLRQPLHMSQQYQEFHASSETVFDCSQNPLVGFFKVDFDVCAFLRTRVLGLQVKFLFRSLLSFATSIFCLVLIVIVELLSGCNRV
ncbi:hypothetical protein Bca4012_083659 [Brassica carinata]